MKNKNSTTVKQLLQDQLGITRQAVEAKKKAIIKKFGPMVDIEAYSVLCQQNGIDTSRYLSSEEAKRVRDVYQLIQPKSNGQISERNGGKNSLQGIIPSISKKVSKTKLKDPLLPSNTLVNAVEMSKVYAKLFVFENSLRVFVSLIMEKKYGNDWWNLLNTPKAIQMKRGAEKRMADEKRNPWHGKRGSHPIYYTDLSDFADFIDEKWPDFKEFFPSKEWIKTRIDEISRSRNCVDHHNCLNDNDISRLNVYFEDWFIQLDSSKQLL